LLRLSGTFVAILQTMLLRVQGVSRKEGDYFTVNDVSLALAAHEKLAIVGATGSGKSTLLQMIAGHVQPTSGSIYFKDEKVLGPHEQLLPGHKGIAYISQYFELRNNYKVWEWLELENKATAETSKHIYELCDITHLLHRKTHELSGGEKQRIALARLLTKEPSLLILDEPFSNLDMHHKVAMKALIAAVSNRLGITVMLVSHDPFDTLSWATSIMVLEQGSVVQHGTPQAVYQHPVSAYVAGLLGAYMELTPAALSKLHPGDLLAADKSQFIRPEQLALQVAGIPEQQAVVHHVHFYGCYQFVEVRWNNTPMWVQQPVNAHWQVGQVCYLHLPVRD